MNRRKFSLSIVSVFVALALPSPAAANPFLVRLFYGLARAFFSGTRTASRSKSLYRTIPRATMSKHNYSTSKVYRYYNEKTHKGLWDGEKKQMRSQTRKAVQELSDEDFSISDKRVLRENLVDLVDLIFNQLEQHQGEHIYHQWMSQNYESVVANRAHLQNCEPCKRAYETLTKNTELRFIALTSRAKPPCECSCPRNDE